MPGTINSLGIGSGILTADVIDQLRAADEEILIKPLEDKINENTQKVESLKLLNDAMTEFEDSVTTLNSVTLYQGRSVESSGTAATATAAAGTDVQSFSVDVTTLARGDIFESGAFSAKTQSASTAAGTYTINVGTNTFNIDYEAGISLEDLKFAINDTAGDTVTASILQVGESDFRLILTSKIDGAGNDISISDTGGIETALQNYDATTNPDGIQEIQNATDASFDYNGITITRSTNTIDDLIVGVTLTLAEEGSSSKISISQDQEAITEAFTTMAEKYNALVTQADAMTKRDPETNEVGIFNGNRDITSIASNINNILTEIDYTGDSLINLGIDIDRKGVMSFDSSKLTAALNSDPNHVEFLLAGGSEVDTYGNTQSFDGIFAMLEDKVDSYTSFSNGQLKRLDDGLDKNLERLKDDVTKNNALITSRYDTMAQRFVAYDAIISRINNQFNVLDQQIQASLAAANQN